MSVSPITLLIPCYNAARYLPRLAESVRAQTRPFSEILCYDDGSTDNTVEVARQLGWRILTPNTNAGPSSARNRLLSATESEWVHFHDADDILAPQFVARMSSVIASTPTVDVVVCDMDWNDETTGELRRAWRYSGLRLAEDPLAETIRNPIGVIACVYRRARLLAVGGFDERFRTWEDGDLHVRLAASGARFVTVPQILAYGLRHSSGASADHHRLDTDRVRQLEHYIEAYPKCRAIGEEAERLAIRLFESNSRDPRIVRLIRVCRRNGHAIPSTRHPAWIFLRGLLPTRATLYLRRLARRLPLG